MNAKQVAMLLIPVLVMVAAGLIFFTTAGRDDAHITYWSAYSLARYGEIVNYNGDRVEQSSSLLQVVLMALASLLLPLDMVDLGVMFSLILGALAIGLTWLLARRIESGAAFLAAMLTGASAYFIYWSLGGLETTLAAVTSLGLLITWSRYLESGAASLTAAAAAMFLFLLTRPESPVVTACILAGAIALAGLKMLLSTPEDRGLYRSILKKCFHLSLIFIVAMAVIFLFRRWYFGSIFPQPVAAKSVGLSISTIAKGWEYLGKYLFSDVFISLLTVLTVVAAVTVFVRQLKTKTPNPAVTLIVLYMTANMSFVLLAGGDWMEAGRFLVHQLPAAMVLTAVFIMRVIRPKHLLAGALTVIFLVQAGAVFKLAQNQSSGMPVWSTAGYYKSLAHEYGFFDYSFFERYHRVHIRDIPVIYHLDRILQRLTEFKKGEAVTLMSGQAGMVAYYTAKKYFGAIRFIDRHGLCDRTLTGCTVSAGSRRYSMGLYFLYPHFFKKRKAFERKCGITAPDVIFDLKFKDADYLVKQGYTVIYSQEGDLSSGSSLFPGFKMYFDQFIAVRNDLAPALQDIAVLHLEYNAFH